MSWHRTWLFARRTMKEIMRDPVNLFFGLAFPVLLLWALSLIYKQVGQIPGAATISGDELADTAKTEARYTVKGLLGKQLLYTARQKDGVLTLDVPAEVATFRTTIEDMQTLQANGVKTLVLVTEKNTTTLNLSLLCEGQKSGTRVTLRHLGSNATLSVGLRCRRDLLIGR